MCNCEKERRGVSVDASPRGVTALHSVYEGGESDERRERTRERGERETSGC